MSVIKVEGIAFVRYRAPDLDDMAGFLADFGLNGTLSEDGRLYARGSGESPFLHVTEPGEPGFAGLALQAISIDDLAALAQAEGTEPTPLAAPGGGWTVRLFDPDGLNIEVVAGRASGQSLDGAAKRTGRGPASVVRINHIVLNVSDFRASERWYKDRFGFITSDEMEASPGKAVGAFMRCDRGDRPTDHHTVALGAAGAPPGCNHVAFDVRDIDDMMAGHDHLDAKARDPFWGVGRHGLGGHIFDYWRDPFGNLVEHCIDGELFTAADATRIRPASSATGSLWGPQSPRA